MSEWTKSARREFAKYFDEISSQLKTGGASPTEVQEDIRQYIEEKAQDKNISVIDGTYVRQVLADTNFFDGLEIETPKSIAKPQGKYSHIRKSLSGSFVLIFGVILPLTALIFEAVNHWCGSVFFDPIPTVFHILLIAFVPISNLLIWIMVRTKYLTYHKAIGWLNALSIGISGYYTVLFAPITPIGFIGSFILIGLLPLAPLFSFISAIICRNWCSRIAFEAYGVRLPNLVFGILLSFLVLTAFEVPVTVTKIGLDMASSQDAKKSLRGIQFLRRWGNKNLMLRSCYVQPGRATDIISFFFSLGDPATPDQSRKIYYRVTGKPFNSVKPNLKSRHRIGFSDSLTWDADLGGDIVGGVIKNLSLSSSRIDGVISATSSTAYIEWIMTFKNHSGIDREARTQIKLPKGAVVSRVTLWVNGEEREAAFAARGKVTKAYKKVVRQRRDPVLVTTSGPDMIQMQLFPVPRNRGTMKVRVGITAPLILGTNSKIGYFQFPHLVERNFQINKELEHSIWIESKGVISPSSHWDTDHLDGSVSAYRLRAQLHDSELLNSNVSTLTIDRRDSALVLNVNDVKNPNSPPIIQTLTKETHAFDHLVAVIDVSAQTKVHSDVVEKILQSAASQNINDVVLANDQVTLIHLEKNKDINLSSAGYDGGYDNVAALLKAWDLASEKPNSAILWIHGPQPVLLGDIEQLKQIAQRAQNGPPIFAFALVPGPNNISKSLGAASIVNNVPRLGAVKADLVATIKRLSGEHQNYAMSWRKGKVISRNISKLAKDNSQHVVRLWAFNEINRLVREGSASARRAAVALASQYQLVTPVSGAVVLETQKQYDEAELNPVDAGTVPTIPEPEVWLLLFVLIIAIAVACRFKLVPKLKT